MNEADLNALKAALKEFTKQLKKSNESTAPQPGQPQGDARFDIDGSERESASVFSEKLRLEKERQRQVEKDHLRDLLAIKELHKKEDQASLNILKEQLEERDKELDLEIQNLALKTDKTKEEEEILKIKMEQGEQVKKQIEFLEIEDDARKEITKELIKQNREKNVSKKLDEEANEAAIETGEVVKGITNSALKAMRLKSQPNKGLGGFLGSIIRDGESGKSALEQMKSGTLEFRKSLTKTNIAAAAVEIGVGGVTRILQAAVEAVIGAILFFDNLGASIAKTTGHGRDFAQQYIDVASSLDQTGTDAGQLTNMMVELGTSLRGVGGMGIDTMGDFAKLGVEAKRLGMDIQDLTEITKFQTIGLGRSTEDVKQSIQNLNAAAVTMGMDFSDLSKQFTSTQATFAVFGNRSEKVFLRTMSAARQLGVEMSDVVQLADKFKTFDSAADSVADLNFIMGGQFLDSLELMELRAQGPEAVMKKIKDSFDATGKSFEDMSLLEQEALAEAAGLDFVKARQMFTGKIEEDSLTAVEQATQSFNEFSKRGRETMTIMERIAGIAKKVGIQIAAAFGFDQFATGKATDLLDSFERFAQQEIVGKLVPMIRDDIFPAMQSFGDFLTGFTSNSLIRSMFSLDEVEAKRKKEEAQKIQDEANVLKRVQTVTTDEKGADEGRQKKIAENLGFKDFEELQKKQASLEAQAQETLKEAHDIDPTADTGLSGKQMAMLTTAMGVGMFGTPVIAGAVGAIGYAGMKAYNYMDPEIGSLDKGQSGPKGLAQGGMTLSSGAVMVGEKGPEIVVLPSGATTIPNDAFARTGSPYNMDTTPSQRGQGETKVEVSINVDDRKLREVFSTTVEQVLVGA